MNRTARACCPGWGGTHCTLALCRSQPQGPLLCHMAVPALDTGSANASAGSLEERCAQPRGHTAGGMNAPGPASAAPDNCGSQACQQHSPSCHPLPRHSHVEFWSSGPFHRARVLPSPAHQSDHDCSPAASTLRPHIKRLTVVPLPQAGPNLQPCCSPWQGLWPSSGAGASVLRPLGHLVRLPLPHL